MPLVMSADPDWVQRLEQLPPGDHAAILSGTSQTGVTGRLAGFELRDVLLALLPGPATGFVFLFRMPIAEATVTAQVLATGMGGLNIAGCRVGLSGGTKRSFQAPRDVREDGIQDRSTIGREFRTGHRPVEVASGRWPPNVLLVHAAECRQVGERVKGDPRTAKDQLVPERGKGGFVDVGSRAGEHGKPGGHVYGDKDGFETVVAWACGPRCPVPVLDNLSGIRPSTLTGRADPRSLYANPGDNGGKSLFGGGNSAVYADEGGASRFYPQFPDHAALLGWLAVLVGERRP